MAHEARITRTLIVESDTVRAKEFAKSLRGNEADTRCTFATTNQEALDALLGDPNINEVCFHGSVSGRDEGKELLRLMVKKQRTQAAHG